MSEDYTNKFAKQLLLERTTLGLNQQQVADAVSISQQSIAKWEIGNSYPRMAALDRLCNFFECEFTLIASESQLRDASSVIPAVALNMNSLSHWLRYARKRKNLRQEDVANELCVLRSTIAHWETARSKPTKEILEKFELLVGEQFEGDIESSNSNFKLLNHADIDAILICSKLQKTSTYDLIMLVQLFLKEKNS